MSGALLLRSRQEMPRWPRRREGALKDERTWINSLDDRELAQLAAELHAVDKAVKDFRGPVPRENISPLLEDEA
jgi:hypothetical protein